MSLTIQPSPPSAAQARPGALPAIPPPAVRDVTGASGVLGTGTGTTAAFSPAAVLLAQLQAAPAGSRPVLPAPGSAQATALTTLLAQRMGVLLREARLPSGPPLVFELGGDDQVRVATNRPDAAALQALVNAHADVQVLVRLLHAINLPPDAWLPNPNLAPQTRRENLAEREAAHPPAPLHNLWGWPGTRPGPPRPHSGLLLRLAWGLAAALAILGFLAWLW